MVCSEGFVTYTISRRVAAAECASRRAGKNRCGQRRRRRACAGALPSHESADCGPVTVVGSGYIFRPLDRPGGRIPGTSTLCATASRDDFSTALPHCTWARPLHRSSSPPYKRGIRQLMLGATRREATTPLTRMRAVLPYAHHLFHGGLEVSLCPGMMTGRSSSACLPLAVKYQILFMFLIAGGTVLDVTRARRRLPLTDGRHRLRSIG